ncbi:anhydro-N-acetylmuramic acid kinase [Methylocapsa polymorpha]|uniref:Anhydro-N-acetylmuramic acid kinase n=1 Tax=Methylocapsa polymorpha TaxID=3080828 RepID=A0ABZ0HPI7_9HYPH|nr:anhydro-N-acetylmuramic acid kinase [Methylocapsa sp. RX1]
MSLTRAIGLMSGTSMDGVDVAFIETDGEDAIALRAAGFFPYTQEDRALLRSALDDARSLEDRRARPGALAPAEAMVTSRHAEAVERFLAAENIDRATIDLIGFHGQTVLHRPERGLTAQIGDGAGLAEKLKLKVAYDFRAADVLRGGQGAPLVPVFHRALAAAAGFAEPVAIINIGGIANVSFVEADKEPIAFDAGPGNALVDDLMLARTGAAIDRDGAAAAKGKVDEALLSELLAHAFFALEPPKSLDRNDFSGAAVARLGLDDAAATLTAFTAAGIARAFMHLPSQPTLAIICGGGARNPTLMRELSLRLSCRVASADSFGWSADAMEAQAFAYLAVRCVKGLPITFPTTTGAPAPLSGGVLGEPNGR